MDIKKILTLKKSQQLEVTGWVKSIRVGKNIAFIVLQDGSTFSKLQIVCKNDLENFNDICKLTISTAIKITGELKITEGQKQACEILASEVKILKSSDLDFPLQKKEHSMEFLRSIAHLRPKSDYFFAVFKIRSFLFQKIHQFYAQNNFHYLTSPLITSNDCEGAGESFVLDSPTEKNFFSKQAMLSVSGQLMGEAFAQSFKNIYVFGPAFRAEKSNTTKHLAEFWMLEPELAFCDLEKIINHAKELVEYLTSETLRECLTELEYLSQVNNLDLITRLKKLNNFECKIISYTEAIKILEKNKEIFENKNIHWGMDLQTEHEKFLCEKEFQKPIFVTHYPKEIKAFYMKQDNDGKTVQAFDFLVEGIGELIGGSVREDDYDILNKTIERLNISKQPLEWYLNLRKYGYDSSAGFGLGFERLIMYITGTQNIRDCIPFPRSFNYLYF
ncbi:hypothetical protein ASO20_02090 [Mycoplasma sp. (ex Biomphalaria glabrata)]|uniref:asparagine--tRNA ligase n=1 Tax=Mycoplasma sp. (ex Biomphalaria glabrata) TaxID=1749074 RepID=UPI00073A8963|nr:asparagine--tRNA ligase [Mycoplasma sp. (ex Biomphalaria glabrata)]ALV23432.1 hypothetical protein ASO20_02090 [Mycoplasma sp. (ex Biomphalaria glabrata)]